MRLESEVLKKLKELEVERYNLDVVTDNDAFVYNSLSCKIQILKWVTNLSQDV